MAGTISCPHLPTVTPAGARPPRRFPRQHPARPHTVL